MNIAMLVNPKSGRGRADAVAQLTCEALRHAGHHVIMHQIRTQDHLAGDVLVIVGGDGTVHHSLPIAARLGVPVWQIPMGTENLFARNFGMTREPGSLVRAVAAMSVEVVDLAECCVMSDSAAGIRPGGTPGPLNPSRHFALMLSIGPDAGVVRRLAELRSGAIRHWSYVAPMVREAFWPSLSPMTIQVDGRRVVDGRRGLLVVANSCEYGVRLNPCPRASMSDGLLDVAFFPAETSLEVIAWALRSRMGRHSGSARLVHNTGCEIRVRCAAGKLPIQFDGESGGVIGTSQELLIRVKPGAMKVLRGVG